MKEMLTLKDKITTFIILSSMNKIKKVQDCIPLFIFLLTAKLHLIFGFVIYGYDYFKEIISLQYIVVLFIVSVIFFTLCQYNLCYTSYIVSILYMIINLMGIGYTFQNKNIVPMSKFNIFTFIKAI